MPIDYTIKAIPTLYNGRLEYEPGDISGWAPDFLIRTTDTPILVEVKPITYIDQDTCDRIAKSARKAVFKGSLLLIGTCPFKPSETTAPGTAIGWLGYTYHPYPFEDYGIGDWCEAVMCEAKGSLDIFGAAPAAEVCGLWDETIRAASPASIDALWAAATNAVQWRGQDFNQ